jgi:hypothetical protein
MTGRVLCVVTLLLASIAPTRGAGQETFGVAPTLSEVTPIAKVLARPADFEGKTVRVEGVVTAVCQMMGCWMALAPVDAPEGSAVLVKVDDGVIVFPTSARGRRAAAQGIIERVGSGDAEGQEAAHEHAQQTGRTQPAAADHWQLKTTGAILY